MKRRNAGPLAWAAVALVLTAGQVAAQPGSAGDPIVVRLAPGKEAITITGALRHNHDCCAYRIRARAGQSLIWRLTGPNVRTTITYPDGHGDGPGLPAAIPLPDDGDYVFAVSPDLMADNAFGRFVLRLRLPPAHR